MVSVFLNYYKGWLIAAGVIFLLFLFIPAKQKNGEKVHRSLTFVVALVPSVACLLTGLFFAIPKTQTDLTSPTATPLPGFPGRLLTWDLTEIVPGGIELTIVEHNIPEAATITDFVYSPSGDYLLGIGEQGSLLINVQTWDTRAPVIEINGSTVFSPDGKYLATGIHGNIFIEEIETGQGSELLTAKCNGYSIIGGGGGVNACVYVGEPVWVTANQLLFIHDEALYDPNYVFPESITISMGQDQVLGNPEAFTVITIQGDILAHSNLEDFNFRQNVAGENSYCFLDVNEAMGGNYRNKCLYISDDLYNVVEESWVGEYKSGILSPDQKYLLLAPNVLIDTATNESAVIFDIQYPYQYTTCVWHPDSEQIACTYMLGELGDENARYFIKTYSLIDQTSNDYEVLFPVFLAAWLK